MKKEIRLSSRIYLLEFFSAVVFFLVGMFLWAPSVENQPYFKVILIGSQLVPVIVGLVLVFSKKSEHIDDRAKINLYKAAFFVFIALVLFLIIMSVIFSVFSIDMQLGVYHFCFLLAAILLLHACSFYYYEQKGE